MNDYFDHVERELRAAVRRHDHLPWYVRLRLRHSRPLVVVLAALVIAGPALAAVTLLQSGSSVGPQVPPTSGAYDGVAIKSSIELLSLRTTDPAGGLPWGMRIIRTTRGVVCIQVGRLAFGTVGALGRDGAFKDDGRFHPFSANYETGPPCSVPDAHGNAFINVAWSGIPASALIDGYGEPSCTAPRTLPSRIPLSLRRTVERRLRALFRSTPSCPTADLRNVYYGLLGPDAVSISYRSLSGKLVTSPTGPDGSYLIVLRGHPSTNNNGYTYDTRTVAGPLTAIHYRDGHICRPGWCFPVGYASPTGRLPTPAQVATPVSTRVERSNGKAWCVRLDPPGVPAPCRGPATPAGYQRIQGGPAEQLVLISWISRVAVTNGHSYYYLTYSVPKVSDNNNEQVDTCGVSAGGGSFGETRSNYKAGQRVTQSFWMNEKCHGLVRGNIALVITTGPTAPAPMPAVRGQSVGREVGHFTVDLP